MATELNDTTLLARISRGDIVAIEAKYHLSAWSSTRILTEVHREQQLVSTVKRMKTDVCRL